MSVSTVKETMLYCPKCQQTYEEGTQRFCTNEGGRLLSAPSATTGVNKAGGVFTNLLGRTAPTDDPDLRECVVVRSARGCENTYDMAQPVIWSART